MDNERELVKIVKEICAENQIEFQSFSYDWILQLRANSRTMFIYGYKFPNNNAAIEHICNDKSALSDILDVYDIPHIPHHYFTTPSNRQYTGENGDWERMSKLLQKHGKLVCKSNTGTGGRNVFKVESQKDLEFSVYEIFLKTKSICIAPYRNIHSEYRVIIINAKVGVIYEKKRPFVIGNGVDTIESLIKQNSTLSDIELNDDLILSYIPAPHEVVDVAWKHNLGQGAYPVIVTDTQLIENLTNLALTCTTALDAEFMSIDIVEDECGLEVLEINSGIMMEHLAKSSEDNYLIAKDIYRMAILGYLKMDDPKYQYRIKQPRKRRFVLPILEEIARERNIEIIPDLEEGNFSIFIFNDNKRFVAKDYPFNINYAGSISLCTNKAACSCFLETMGFHVPKQKYLVKKADVSITLAELTRIFDNPVEKLGYGFPMIIKPNSLSQGTGVFKITDPHDGIIAAKRVLGLRDKIFLLQEYCTGSDYRIVVLNNTVIQAYERIPFQIIGNGRDTIAELLENMASSFVNLGRDKRIDTTDSRIEKCILSQGYNKDTILGQGVICRLQDVANLSLGGTTVDKTNEITPFYRELAINVAKSLNLMLCGIDIIADDVTNVNNTDYSILEVNSAPGLDNYVYTEEEQQRAYVKQLYSKVFDYLETLGS